MSVSSSFHSHIFMSWCLTTYSVIKSWSHCHQTQFINQRSCQKLWLRITLSLYFVIKSSSHCNHIMIRDSKLWKYICQDTGYHTRDKIKECWKFLDSSNLGGWLLGHANSTLLSIFHNWWSNFLAGCNFRGNGPDLYSPIAHLQRPPPEADPNHLNSPPNVLA